MKSLTILSVLFLFLSINLSAKNSLPATVDELANNLDMAFSNGNTDLLEDYLAPVSNYIINNRVTNKFDSYSLKEFMTQIKGKLGKYDVKVLDQDNNQAVIKMEQNGDRLNFTNHITCVNSGEGWRIVNFTMTLSKK